jgi:hypothetical protein
MIDRGLTVTGTNVGEQRETQDSANLLNQADSRTAANDDKHTASDYESEGRRFESWRARS